MSHLHDLTQLERALDRQAKDKDQFKKKRPPIGSASSRVGSLTNSPGTPALIGLTPNSVQGQAEDHTFRLRCGSGGWMRENSPTQMMGQYALSSAYRNPLLVW